MKSKSKLKLRSKSRSTSTLTSRISSQNSQNGAVLKKGWLKFVAIPVARWIKGFPEKFEVNPAY
jgi:hypothetical protein